MKSWGKYKWPALLLESLWAASGMRWQKATNRNSPLVHSLGSVTTKNHKQTNLEKPNTEGEKKSQKKIYLIIKVIFLEQSVSHQGYYYLKRRKPPAVYVPPWSICTPLGILQRRSFYKKAFIYYLPILPTWVWEKLCKTFSTKAKSLQAILFL